MNDIPVITAEKLEMISQRLSRIPAVASLAAEVDHLRHHLEGKCVVAVVGRMNAGKSTFINALLGVDLAVVAATETTATVNHFVWGDYDPGNPRIRAHYLNGQVVEITREVADSLQGHDLHSLRRAAEISHLEYMLRAKELLNVTLIDTPGTSAVVAEHQHRIEEVITPEHYRLLSDRQKRNQEETNAAASSADAVIYLFDAIVRADEKRMLTGFQQSCGASRAINAIGVLGKIDLDEQIIDGRHNLADRLAAQLHAQLAGVVPVSAALHRAIDRLMARAEDENDFFAEMVSDLRSVPQATLKMLLLQDKLFVDHEDVASPLSASRRREMLDAIKLRLGREIDWCVFTTIAREIMRDDSTPAQVADRLREIAGFSPLLDRLDKYFFQRGRILRCHRIAAEVRNRVLNRLEYEQVDNAGRAAAKSEKLLQQFVSLIRASPGDRKTAKELEEFVRGHLDPALQIRELRQALDEVRPIISALIASLKSYNDDFAADQQLLSHPREFTDAEFEELHRLFGGRGLRAQDRLPATADEAYLCARQDFWRKQYDHHAARRSVRRLVADRADTIYGRLLNLHTVHVSSQKQQASQMAIPVRPPDGDQHG